MRNIESYKQFSGFIYDVDDTLLDNNSGPDGTPLHQISKFEAFALAADHFDLPELALVSLEQERCAFRRAKQHSTIGGLTELFDEIYPNMADDRRSEIFKYIKALKEQIHPSKITEHGLMVPGAREIIGLLAVRGYGDRQAIASGAHRAEIEMFLMKFGLHRHFSPARITAYEDVVNHKPDPEGMIRARNSMRISPGDDRPQLVFEDDPKGITAANRLGCGRLA